jgi:C1A family cysteine protease
MLAGMVQFVHGWIPDSDHKKVKDYNARLLLDRVSAPPPSASLRHLIPSILNQGNLGSCTAQAVAQAIRMDLIRKGVANAELLSRLFAYYYARAASPGNTQVDSGTQIRCVFDAIRKLGYCPESAWPYDIDTFTFMPGAAAVRAAYDQRSIYYRITSTGAQRITDICTAVAGGHAVVFGTPVSNAIFDADPTKPLGPPIGETIIGGHAMTVVGYKPGRITGIVDFDIVNSWGEEYGDHGYFTMSDTYLAWSETTDLWIAEIAA